METSALITMILAKGIITVFTFYFFGKMLSTPPQKEPLEEEENVYPRGG